MKSRSIVFCLLPMATVGCRPEQPAPKPPNLILISIDTLRRDHLGCYGYPRATSPNIDALARSGALFENAISTCSWTLPAHASMLTGLYPAFHGLQDDGVTLPPGLPTLAERLNRLGYHTCAAISHVYVSSEFGLDRGFDRFDESLIDGGADNPIAERVVDRFVAVLRAAPDGPFFGFVHFFDPHWSYTPPAPYDTRFTDPNYAGPIDGTLRPMLAYFKPAAPMPEPDRRHAIDLYDGEIAYVDAQIGRLLARLRKMGKMKNTLVVFTADHGEEFKDHGRLGHGKTLFGEQIRVPLIVARHPAFPPGTRRRAPVSLIDLAPTLLELAGADAPDRLQGRSLAKADPPRSRHLVSESIRFGNELRSIRSDRHKLLHRLQGDQRVYFDLVNDPGETRPLPRDPTGGALDAALNEYAAAADSGWHLKLIALQGDAPLRCRGTIQTPGRLMDAKRYFSGNISPPSRVDVPRFDLAEDGKSLAFEIVMTRYMGEINFETDPPDAPITLTIDVDGPAPNTGVFLGAGTPLTQGRPVTLTRSDPRLAGLPENYARTPSGCYIRSIIDPAATAPRSNLSNRAINRLKALGYVGSDDEK